MSQSNLVVLPSTHIADNMEMWVQEAIFGHRFVNDQRPYMIVLETLSVCRSFQVEYSSAHPNGKVRPETMIFRHEPAQPDRHECLKIRVPKQGPLRFLLFKGRPLKEIESEFPNKSKEEILDQWIHELNETYPIDKNRDTFTYLKNRFDDDYATLKQTLEIVQGLQIDTLNNRRWTSQFLMPRGPHLLLHDLDEKLVSDRRFFGRGGEVVYLMLNRSSQAPKLAKLLHQAFFPEYDEMDRMAQSLSPDEEHLIGESEIGYLPILKHDAYDRMAEDWVRILELNSLIPPKTLEPISRITALDLVCYFIERAEEVSTTPASGTRPSFKVIPLDMTDGARKDLLGLSKAYLKRIRSVIDEAIDCYIRSEIQKNDLWKNAGKKSDPASKSSLARQAIKETFKTDVFKDQENVILEPEEWLARFIKLALERKRNQISKLIEPLGKDAGFITARPGTGTWFGATDSFLESLVLANVTKSMTIGDFLDRLYQRYGLVIGPVEAGKVFSSEACDITAFEENVMSLERRLQGLGFAQRLSDDVAFVVNPYFETQLL